MDINSAESEISACGFQHERENGFWQVGKNDDVRIRKDCPKVKGCPKDNKVLLSGSMRGGWG